MDEVRYSLPEAKLLQLLYNSMVYGFVFGCIVDQPNPPNYDASEDYDPMDKNEGTARWCRETSKEMRRKLRRYKQKPTDSAGTDNGTSSHGENI